MSGKQFQFSLVFRADTAAGKAGLTDLASTFDRVSAAGDKAGASARKQAADLQAMAAATARAISGQDQLVAAEKRAQEARARALIAPLANPAATQAPLQAAFRATETAAGSLQGAVSGLTVSIGSQAQELVETANASRIYQSALDDIRASFNPLFAASRAYEMQLERIAEAEKIGAISAREAAAARVAAAERLAPAVQPGAIGQAGRVSPWTANIGAQGFDVGVTAMMGMHPAMIGFQQGSQLAGIAQQMGGGRGALKEIGSGLMSILNTTSLVTIGLTTMVAFGIQGFMKLAGGAKTLEDRMGDLATAFDRYEASAEVAGSSSMDLARKFGVGAAGAQGLYTILANLDRLSLDQKLKATSTAIRETIGMLASDNHRGGSEDRIAEFFDLGGSGWGRSNPRQASLEAFHRAVNNFEAAEGVEAQTAAMQVLLQQVRSLATLKDGISDDEQALIDLIKEQADVLLGIQAIETARADAIKRQVDQMALGYRHEAELLAATTQFGSESAEVEKLKARQARENLDIRLEELGVLKGSADWLRMHAELALKLAAEEEAAAEARRERVRDQQDSIAAIEREIVLIGVGNAERLRANAIAEAEIEIRKRHLTGLDAWLERVRAIAKAEAEARRDREKALYDIGIQGQMDAFDAQIAGERNPYIRAAIEAEKEYARQLGDGADAQVAAAAADRVRAKALADLRHEQAEFLRGQREGIDQLQLELALIGQTEATRARVLALAQAERDITRLGITGQDADLLRRQAVAQAELSLEIEAQAEAWQRVQSAGESAIDGIIDKLRAGDVKGAFADLLGEIEQMWFDLAVKNPLKNLILGTNLGTWEDVGGWGGIWDRLTGRSRPDEASLVSQAVQAMTVTAASVTIGGPGAMAFLSSAGAANSSAAPGALGTWAIPAPDVQAILSAVAVGGGARPDAISGLNSAFAAPLAVMVQEAERIFGEGAVRITSAFRSVERQQQLWEEALRKYGSAEEARKWVAPPGSSRHNFGLAADLQYGSADIQRWFHENAARYGLGFRMGNEPWHIEPQNASQLMAGSIPAMTVPAVQALTDLGATAAGVSGNLSTLGKGADQATAGAVAAGRNLAGFGQQLGGLLAGIGAQHGPGGILVGGLLNWALTGSTGFGGGGPTGPGADTDVAGVVHANEFVFDARSTRRIGVANLEALRRGTLRGYQDGGYVTGGLPPMRPMPADGPAPAAHPASDRRVVFEINVSGQGDRELREGIHAAIAQAFDIYGRDVLPAETRRIVNDRWSA